MRKLLVLLIVATVFSCANPWDNLDNFYISFEDATEHITSQYGDPTIVRETVYYDDGTVRNVVAYWEISPPEIVAVEVTLAEGMPNEYTYIRYDEYITYSIEVWHQKDSDVDALKRYRFYGWEILRETKSKSDFVR